MHAEQRFKVKQIYNFASEYLRSWFPLLTSYEAFDVRINRLGEALKHLATQILADNCCGSCHFDVSLLDSLPIITFSGKRTARVE
jgi:hypothetical protein